MADDQLAERVARWVLLERRLRSATVAPHVRTLWSAWTAFDAEWSTKEPKLVVCRSLGDMMTYLHHLSGATGVCQDANTRAHDSEHRRGAESGIVLEEAAKMDALIKKALTLPRDRQRALAMRDDREAALVAWKALKAIIDT